MGGGNHLNGALEGGRGACFKGNWNAGMQKRCFERAQRPRQLDNRPLRALALRPLLEQHFFNILERLRLPLQPHELPLKLLPRCPFTIKPLCQNLTVPVQARFQLLLHMALAQEYTSAKQAYHLLNQQFARQIEFSRLELTLHVSPLSLRRGWGEAQQA